MWCGYIHHSSIACTTHGLRVSLLNCVQYSCIACITLESLHMMNLICVNKLSFCYTRKCAPMWPRKKSRHRQCTDSALLLRPVVQVLRCYCDQSCRFCAVIATSRADSALLLRPVVQILRCYCDQSCWFCAVIATSRADSTLLWRPIVQILRCYYEKSRRFCAVIATSRADSVLLLRPVAQILRCSCDNFRRFCAAVATIGAYNSPSNATNDP